MTTHLSTQESVNAIDGVLAESRQAHLDACASCRAEVDGLRSLMADVGDAKDVPEPSPLFWDHFQSRVQTAVQVEMARPARASWWSPIASVRGALAAAATVAVAAVAVALYLGDPVATPGTTVAMVGDESTVRADAEWEFVSGMMGTFGQDDVREVLAPSPRAVDAAFEALTSDERDAFVKLLTAELVEGME